MSVLLCLMDIPSNFFLSLLILMHRLYVTVNKESLPNSFTYFFPSYFLIKKNRHVPAVIFSFFLSIFIVIIIINVAIIVEVLFHLPV